MHFGRYLSSYSSLILVSIVDSHAEHGELIAIILEQQREAQRLISDAAGVTQSHTSSAIHRYSNISAAGRSTPLASQRTTCSGLGDYILRGLQGGKGPAISTPPGTQQSSLETWRSPVPTLSVHSHSLSSALDPIKPSNQSFKGLHHRSGTLHISATTSKKHQETSALASKNTTGTAAARSLVTSTPVESNASIIVPNGMVYYANATFRTSCAPDEFACYATCTSYAQQCYSAWEYWSAVLGPQSWAETGPYTMASTVESIIHTQKTKTVSGYVYALSTPTAFSTVFNKYTTTMLSMETLMPTPTCEWPKFSCTGTTSCKSTGCTVMGGTVETLYWPPSSSGAPKLGNSTAKPLNANSTSLTTKSATTV